MKNFFKLITSSSRILFNFSFSKRITAINLVPVIYPLLLIGSVGIIAHFVWSAFDDSNLRGWIYVMASPFSFVFLAAICRVLLEFLILMGDVAKDIHVVADMSDAIKLMSNDTRAIADMGRSLDEISFDIKTISSMKGSLNQLSKVVEHVETIAEMSVSLDKIAALGENIDLITVMQQTLERLADLGSHIEAIADMRYSLEKLALLTDNIDAIAKMSEALDKVAEIGDVVSKFRRVPFMRSTS
jgi:hypothetical protein